jgi:SPP1 gp7 family putative phage head morphogenesis protein
MEAPYRRRIAESLFERVRKWMQDVSDNPALLEDDNAILEPDYDAMSAIHEFFMRSFLMGMEDALSGSGKSKKDFADIPLLPDMPISVLPFEEAIAFAKTQIPLTKKEYYALDDKLRLRAFTVGRLNDADAVNRMKGIMLRNMEQGGGFAGFAKMTKDEILDGVGFGKGDGSYYETVYRTNQATSYNAGRAMAYEETPPIALELIGINDSRQTDLCHSLTSPPFRRKYGDPVWNDLWPPLHFNCRTTVRAIYDQAEIDGAGGPEKFYSQAAPDFAPAKGFGGYPLDKESYWRLTPEMLKRARDYGIDGEIAAAAIRLGMPAYAQKIVQGGFETLYPVNGAPLAELPSGGYIRRAKAAKPGLKNEWDAKGNLIQTDEIGLAKKAADEGHRVFFMPESAVATSPDTIIDGHTAEIKHITGSGKNTIEESIKRGRKQQSTLILMEVPAHYSHGEITRQVRNRLRNSEHLQIVLVSWGDKFLHYAK